MRRRRAAMGAMVDWTDTFSVKNTQHNCATLWSRALFSALWRCEFLHCFYILKKRLFVCRMWNMSSGLSHGETTQTGQQLCDIQDEEVLKLCWNFPKHFKRFHSETHLVCIKRNKVPDFWKFYRSFYAKWLAVQFYDRANLEQAGVKCPY